MDAVHTVLEKINHFNMHDTEIPHHDRGEWSGVHRERTVTFTRLQRPLSEGKPWAPKNCLTQIAPVRLSSALPGVVPFPAAAVCCVVVASGLEDRSSRSGHNAKARVRPHGTSCGMRVHHVFRGICLREAGSRADWGCACGGTVAEQ